MQLRATPLDAAFHALSDPTRRAVIRRLTPQPRSVSELAKPFDIGLPTFLKHLKVLETAGLIITRKQGRVRTCQLRPARLKQAEDWLGRQRAIWEAQADRMVDYIENHMTKEDTP